MNETTNLRPFNKVKQDLKMEYKKSNVPTDTQTRDMAKLSEDTDNVYETVMIIAKRANQIGQIMKHNLETKLQEYASPTDSLDEVFENPDQIEVSRMYERMPKPTLIAASEYESKELYYRIASMPSAPLKEDLE